MASSAWLALATLLGGNQCRRRGGLRGGALSVHPPPRMGGRVLASLVAGHYGLCQSQNSHWFRCKAAKVYLAGVCHTARRHFEGCKYYVATLVWPPLTGRCVKRWPKRGGVLFARRLSAVRRGGRSGGTLKCSPCTPYGCESSGWPNSRSLWLLPTVNLSKPMRQPAKCFDLLR